MGHKGQSGNHANLGTDMQPFHFRVGNRGCSFPGVREARPPRLCYPTTSRLPAMTPVLLPQTIHASSIMPKPGGHTKRGRSKSDSAKKKFRPTPPTGAGEPKSCIISRRMRPPPPITIGGRRGGGGLKNSRLRCAFGAVAKNSGTILRDFGGFRFYNGVTQPERTSLKTIRR